MFQRLVEKRCLCKDLFLIFFLTLWLVFDSPRSSFAQKEFLKVTFDHISILDTMVLRELPAGFPHPVLSLITVKDQKNLYVHNLADTARWLSPVDTTLSGDIVGDVWETILEYHEEDKTIPANPDVKQTTPAFMVTELSNVEGFGLSMALAMDYSGSMGDDIYVAEEAARVLIRQMGRSDRAAIIKFTGKVETFQTFTNDTTLLMEAISQPTEDREYTSLYDAIFEATTQCLDEKGRRFVVAYTDGKDNNSTHTIYQVMVHAQENNIPVYLIGLGPKVKSYPLQRIANVTGGVYLYAPTVEDLVSIYLSIYGLIRGYYVMAHTSPDPYYDKTWRIVDLTVNYGETRGRGLGKYFVPYIPLDLKISKGIKTDSLSVVGDDTLYYAMTGDTVSYEVTVINNGPGAAPQVEVIDFLADSLAPIDSEVQPEIFSEDSLTWSFPWIDEGERVSIRYRARVNDYMPMETTELVNSVRMECLLDSVLSDNEDQAVVYAFGLPDFTVRCIPPEIIGSPGYPFYLSAKVENHGSADLTRASSIGFFVQGLGSEPVALDTVSVLSIGDSLQVIGVWPNPEIGQYKIKVMADVNEEIAELSEVNNWDSCTVRVGIDSLTLRVSDVSLFSEIRKVKGGFPGPILTYINVMDQNIRPIHGLADSTVWLGVSEQNQLGEIVGDVWQQVWEYHKEDSLYPGSPDVKSSLSVTEVVGSGISVVLVVDLSNDLATRAEEIKEDLSGFVRGFGNSDWGAVVGVGDSVKVIQSFTQDKTHLEEALDNPFSEQKRRFHDGLWTGITLAQSRSGRNGVIAIVGGKDEWSSHTLLEVLTESQQKGVPLFIIGLGDDVLTDSLDYLCRESGGLYTDLSDSLDLDAELEIIEDLLENYYVLVHTSSDTIQDHTWRVVDVTLSSFGMTRRDRGIYRSPTGAADVSVRKEATGDSLNISERDSTWFVHTNDSVQYRVTIQNVGHLDVQDIFLEDVLPANLALEIYSTTPQSVHGDTVQWFINSLPQGEKLQLSYTCSVDTLTSPDIIALVNQVFVKSEQDTLLLNNSDRDTVYYVPLKPADLYVKKKGIGNSLTVSNGDTTWYVLPGDTVLYKVSLVNQGELVCRNITIQDILPEKVSLLEFSETLFSQRGDTLKWSVDLLHERGARKEFTYTCQVDTFMPPWDVPLLNRVLAVCEDDTSTENNSAQDTVWVTGLTPPNPQVRVTPSLIEPRDSVQVEVMTPVTIQNWDLWVYFEDGSQMDTYWNEFIQGNALTPHVWTPVVPYLGDTWMRTDRKQERVGVIFETVDLWNLVQSDTAFITIRSADEFWLEENTFRPAGGKPLRMRFKLSSNRRVDITIYDMAGDMVKKVADRNFEAGWNVANWDGTDKRGLPVGSGVYVAVLLSGEFRQARKFILVW